MLLFFNMPFLHLGHLGPEYTMMGTRSRLMVDNVIDTNTCNFARTITEIFFTFDYSDPGSEFFTG